MAEALPPLLLPPTPPELLSKPRSFAQTLREWAEGNVRWTEQIIRVLKDTWVKLLAQLNGVIAGLALLTARVATLEARGKDFYVFSALGTLAVGTAVTVVSLNARVVGTLVEAFASVETAPVGASLILDLRKGAGAGTSLFGATKLVIAAGATTGVQTVFAAPGTLAVGDRLMLDVIQVGSTTPGSDATVILVAR